MAQTTMKTLQEALVASGSVEADSLEGFDGGICRLVQFAGNTTFGFTFSVRGSAKSLSLELRSPAEHRHQRVIHFGEELAGGVDPRIAPGYLQRLQESVLGWLREAAESAGQEPAPELISREELDQVLAAERLLMERSGCVQEATLNRQQEDVPASDDAVRDAKLAEEEARDAWQAIYRRVYTWDGKE